MLADASGHAAAGLTTIVGAGEDWFVRYDMARASFDNVEHGVVHDGRIESTRVFFGNRAFGDEE